MWFCFAVLVRLLVRLLSIGRFLDVFWVAICFVLSCMVSFCARLSDLLFVPLCDKKIMYDRHVDQQSPYRTG